MLTWLSSPSLQRGWGDLVGAPQQWMFGASVGAAFVDNSAALFRHVRRAHREIPALWAINADSRDVDAARAVGPVVVRDSFEASLLAQRAAVHVISHGVHDVPTCASPATDRRVLKVRLGHGLTALKKTKPRPLHTNASANRTWGLVPVASEFERAHKREWGIPDENLVVTGLARFDDLLEKRARRAPTSSTTRILYLPTWRDWTDVVPAEIGAFVASPRLTALLERHHAMLHVRPHPLLAKQLTAALATHRGARTIVSMGDIQDELAAADFLVTDYSGVCWDALYVDMPVAFFSFDVNDYERHRGAYIDLRGDLPGPVARTVDDAVDMVGAVLAGGVKLDAAARRWQERAFAFRGPGNSERITQAVLARLEARA